MNLLALETSTERLSIAILRGSELFANDIDAGQRHSELALPLLQALLAEANLTMREFDAIAFGQGPGSFTGVRIACGLAQGLALGTGKSVVPVPTPMALAEQTGAEQVAVAIDARMGEIYFAAYRRNNASATGWGESVAPLLVNPEALPPLDGEGWSATGSAFDVPLLAEQLATRYYRQLSNVVRGMLPRARDVAAIALRQLETAGLASALAPELAGPLYLRNKVAMTIDERREYHAAKMKAVS